MKILKSFYLRFIDDFLKQEKDKFGITDFTTLLCDIIFHLNMFIIVYYMFLNLSNEKVINNPIINENHSPDRFYKRILTFMENLNQINKIDLFLLFKITVNLRNLKVN